MIIEFTQPAIDHLSRGLQAAGGRMRLVYDTQGCGCAVNGVPVLQLLVDSAPAPKELKAESEPFEVWYEPQHEIFFEDKLKIDFNLERSAYVLKSDNQIYTNSLRLIK